MRVLSVAINVVNNMTSNVITLTLLIFISYCVTIVIIVAIDTIVVINDVMYRLFYY